MEEIQIGELGPSGSQWVKNPKKINSNSTVLVLYDAAAHGLWIIHKSPFFCLAFFNISLRVHSSSISQSSPCHAVFFYEQPKTKLKKNEKCLLNVCRMFVVGWFTPLSLSPYRGVYLSCCSGVNEWIGIEWNFIEFPSLTFKSFKFSTLLVISSSSRSL